MATNPEADPLKARRATARDQVKADRATVVPPLADKPVTVGRGEAERRFPLLGDPREPRVVAEAGGALFGVQPGERVEGYTIATEDVYETIIPPGCRTGTSRLRWAAGHHVPTEVYEAWRKSRETPEPAVSGAAD
jgi:hypothetical protein